MNMGGCRDMKRRLRAKFMAADPTCWYCGIGLVWVEGLSGSAPDAPSNLAVIESAVSRRVTRTTQPRGARHYLACYACAHDRARFGVLIRKVGSNDYWAAWRAEHGKPQPRSAQLPGLPKRKGSGHRASHHGR